MPKLSDPHIPDLLVDAISNMPGGSINIFDNDLRYVFAAGRGLTDVGLDPAALPGRTLAEVFGQQAADSVRPFYARAAAGESVVFELPVSRRIYQITATPLPSRDGILAVAHEVTTIREQQAALEETNRQKDAFILTLAHELRQPLAPMLVALELMQKRISAQAGARAREVLERQVRQLQRLTDDLIDAARISQGRTELKRERLDLRTIVEQVLAFAEHDFQSKPLRLQQNLPSTAVWVYGDPVRLQQVFSNLVQNAVKFTDAGGLVSVTMRCERSVVITSIQDTGRGIAPDMLPRVFEMFVQSNDQTGGPGIGLAVVKRLVERHGGTVTAESAGRGLGTEFAVRLPITPA